MVKREERGPAGQVHDGAKCHDACEEMRVFGQRDGERDELGDVLCRLDGFRGVNVVSLAGGDGVVWCAGGDVSGDGGVELRELTVEEHGGTEGVLVGLRREEGGSTLRLSCVLGRGSRRGGPRCL